MHVDSYQGMAKTADANPVGDRISYQITWYEGGTIFGHALTLHGIEDIRNEGIVAPCL